MYSFENESDADGVSATDGESPTAEGAHAGNGAEQRDTPNATWTSIRESPQEDLERGDQVELAAELLRRLKGTAHGAQDLVFASGELWRYSPADGAWHVVTRATQSKMLQLLAGSTVRGGSKPAPLKLGSQAIYGAMSLANDRVDIPDFFTNATSGIAFKNGFVVVDGETVKLLSHSPQHRAVYAYPFDFEPSATPARWLRALDDVFRDDEDRAQKIQMIQEFAGGSLVGIATRYALALVLVGAGANGKSTVARVIESAFPPALRASIAPQDMWSEFRVAMLAGKLLNVVSELPAADIVSSEKFKAMVTGDRMSGRHIRRNPFDFCPVAGHLFAANALPGTSDLSDGFFRRFGLLLFNRTFRIDEQDAKLADNIIESELPGVITWLLQGAARLSARGGYEMPASARAACDAWRRDADTVRRFIEERTRPLGAAELDGGTSARLLYASYKTWCDEEGVRPVPAVRFGTRAKQLGHGSVHMKTGNRYRLRLLPPAE